MQVATKLEIPDLIAAGATKVADLAARTRLPEHALYRVLRVLEMAGIVKEGAGRSFELTEAGALLKTRVPGSMRHIIEWLTDGLHYEVYGA